MMNKCLVFFLELNKMFQPSQRGLQACVSAVDQVARLTSAIQDTLNGRQVLVTIFCNLTSAFDTAWHNGILYKLSRCGVGGAMLRWLRMYLSNRRFQVFFEGEFSSMRKKLSVVPQGAILSPTLFNVLMHDIPSVLVVKCTEYADVTFFASDSNIREALARLQTQLDAFSNWTCH
jgi:hypothetical protein